MTIMAENSSRLSLPLVPMDRRHFLRATALAAATAVAQARAGAPQPVPAAGANPVNNALTWNKAPCRFCGTGCHVQVGVSDGRVVAVAGDREAEVNRGLLCVKGYHVGMILYGRDRLTQPLLRDNNGQPQPISWERAIEVMAERVMRDPAKFAFYGSGQWTIPEGYAAQKFMKAGLGNNHIEANARLCMASAVTGFLSTYGVDEPAGCYDDLDHCDTLIFWGNNAAEMHPVLFSRVIDRRARGEQIELIDIATRRTRTSEHCQHFLLMKPHTDLAIANGIAHLLLQNNTYDRDFVERFCRFRADANIAEPTLMGQAIDFDAYRRRLAEYTPEHVERLSGVPAEQIRMLASRFVDRNRRITSLWCMGMNQHVRGTAINRLVHGIHLLSGHFGRPGDAPTSLTGQPSACGTVREVGTLCHGLPGGRLIANEQHRGDCERRWNVPAGRISPRIGHHTVLMWEKFCTPTDEGGDITTMFVQVTNPGQSLPNLAKTFRAKENLRDKFLIVADVYPTETTELADLVLPAALWVEKNGIFGNSERRTQQWFKMVDPPGQARDDCWMTIALARKLFDLGHAGMRDRNGNFLFRFVDDNGREVPVWDWDRYYDVNVDKQLYEEYRPFTAMKHKNVAPYDELVRARGMRWPVVERDGSWRETRYRFVEGEDPFVEEGKRLQFYHSVTEDDRAQVWFCPYEAPPEAPDNEYPFWLCTGRVLEHWHTGTMTSRVPVLQRAVRRAYVEMHPADAAERNIREGEIVEVVTRRGRLELPVWINGRARPARGNLFVPFFDETRLINDLTLDAVDPISKEPDYKKCAATVRKRNGGQP
jgi:nitrate reductase NapA